MPEDSTPPPDVRPAAASSDLEELLVEALDRFETEGSTGVERLLAEHPQHATQVRGYLVRLGHLGLVDGPAPATTNDFPAAIGEFRLLARLGGGGMGVVYLAEQRSLQRQVALKLIRPEHLYFPGARERFRREIESVARLSHPGIVPVHATGEDQRVPWLAMEHVTGASLDEVLKHLEGREPAKLRGSDLRAAVFSVVQQRSGAPAQRPSAGESSSTSHPMFAGSWAVACLRIARAVATALQHAHERGVLHRDVKPSNIMLTPDGRALLLDFGLAHAEGSARLTASTAQLGSPAYMSPEQVRGETGGIDARSDVYSLGVTLYELLTLHAPFVSDSGEDTRQRVLAGRVESMRTFHSSLPHDAELVCRKAMALERDHRYLDAIALAEDLGNVLELRPVRAQAPGPWLIARRWAQRHPARATAIVALFLVLFVAPTVFLVQQHQANVQIRAALAAARTNRDRAREAVDVMLTRVATEELLNVPRMQQVRRDLLASARSFYERFLADSEGDVELAAQAAESALRLSMLDFELGHSDEARASASRAVQLARGIVAHADDDIAALRILTEALGAEGTTRIWLGDLDGALEDLDEASALHERIVAANPDDLDWLTTRMGTETARAMLLSQMDRPEQTMQSYRLLADTGRDLIERTRGTAHWGSAVERVTSATANEAAYLQGVGEFEAVEEVIRRADGYFAEADVLLTSARLAKARMHVTRSRQPNIDVVTKEAQCRAALADLEALLAEQPEHSNALRAQAATMQDLGLLLTATDRPAEAHTLYAHSIATLRRLLELDPGSIEMRANLAASLCNIGSMQQDDGELEAARASFIEAEERAIDVCETMPARPKFELYRYNATWFRAQVHGGLGEHDELAAAADRLVHLRPDDARTQRIGAGLIALAAGLAAEDPQLTATERTARSTQRLDAAMEHLREAARLGCADVDHLRTDKAFRPLSTRPEYAAVLQAFVANAAAAREPVGR